MSSDPTVLALQLDGVVLQGQVQAQVQGKKQSILEYINQSQFKLNIRLNNQIQSFNLT